MGRPSTYTDEMGNRICDLLTEGKSLRKICMSDKFPHASTVYVWLDRFPDFADKYVRAREAATEDMLEDILEIADQKGLDPQEKRVRIDTRKWVMGRLKPKKYGDKQQLSIGNREGEALKVEGGVDTAALTVQLAAALRAAKAAD
jgi:hypothetical protein